MLYSWNFEQSQLLSNWRILKVEKITNIHHFMESQVLRFNIFLNLNILKIKTRLHRVVPRPISDNLVSWEGRTAICLPSARGKAWLLRRMSKVQSTRDIPRKSQAFPKVDGRHTIIFIGTGLTVYFPSLPARCWKDYPCLPARCWKDYPCLPAPCGKAWVFLPTRCGKAWLFL